MMFSKKMLCVIIALLGILIAVPVWQLSGMLLWGIFTGILTVLILDITMIRPYPLKIKLVFLGLYVFSMICVLCWLFIF